MMGLSTTIVGLVVNFKHVHFSQAQQDVLNKQHQAEKESAKAEISELRQRLEEVCVYMFWSISSATCTCNDISIILYTTVHK